jgi:tetratricopeptide (TPR) repeat protein
MSKQPSPLELVPIDPLPAEDPASPMTIEMAMPAGVTARPVAADASPKEDRFAREAARQLAEGHLDQALWDRANAQSAGDPQKAKALYLRARATALQLLDRERRMAQQARNAAPPAATAVTEALPEEDDLAPPDNGRQRREQRIDTAKYRNAAIAAGVLLVVLAGGWAVLGMLGGNDDGITAATPVPPARATSAPAVPVKAVAANDAGTPAAVQASAVNADFMKKIQELNDAGNWNLLVLYSVEWTRREPADAAAWNQLRDAYVKMRQYDDAVAAAKKAVELAPDNAAYRRQLAMAYVDVDDPAGATRAFDDAVTRDPKDIESLRQLGTMHTLLGKPPEAKAALERALAVDATDPTTLCLRAGFAQMPPFTRDGNANAKQVKAVDAKCHGLGGPVAVGGR